ncbi:unnamed protein product [Pleuronectes platessa]|uniref:Uncharacterized protein n=1 Tax=Pleuronectes platessa TaxID=8262 RepID=A0A9N7UYE8_PLEPL|nr:unnamed protein product [Pleuronectes platessa]
MATEAVVSVGTMTEEEEEEFSDLRENLGQLEKEKFELHESLTSKDDELTQLKTEREELEKETEQWKEEQTHERDKERQQHQVELEELLEGEETDGRVREMEGGGGEETKREERETAASIIPTNLREHSNRDTVMLQSALRGHLVRESQLKNLLKEIQDKTVDAASRSDAASPVGGDMDQRAQGSLCLLQWETGCPHWSREDLDQYLAEQVPRPATTMKRSRVMKRTRRSSLTFTPPGRRPPQSSISQLESGGAAAVDSDDSDDIIVSPSRPLRSREVLML